MSGGQVLLLQSRYDLNMRRIAVLIDWSDRQQPIAAIDQVTNIACECAGIARHGDDDRHAAACDLTRLRLSALARRIKYHGIEAIKLRCAQWRLEQITPLGFDR